MPAPGSNGQVGNSVAISTFSPTVLHVDEKGDRLLDGPNPVQVTPGPGAANVVGCGAWTSLAMSLGATRPKSFVTQANQSVAMRSCPQPVRQCESFLCLRLHSR